MRNCLIAAALAVWALTLVAASVPRAAATTTGTVTGSASTLYVDNQISGTVTPISTATNTPGKAIKAGTAPANMEITPNGKLVYVVDRAGNGTGGNRRGLGDVGARAPR